MNRLDPTPWQHSHSFAQDSSSAERRTLWVIGITALMMFIEIGAGIAFNSMALLADGWHMSTHVAAFVIAALAYYFSRRHASDPRYSFGTGKMGVLGSFASANVLIVIALLMAGESLHRFFDPAPIRFNDAIGVAVLGLVVNLACAYLLKDKHHHGHGHGHTHGESHSHEHDLNIKAAYIHVLADALTSVTAIIALLAGKYFGWLWLDPVMGIVGSAVVAVWAYGLIQQSSEILLDRTPESSDLAVEIRKAVEADGQSAITDLHIWQLSPQKFAAIIAIASHHPKTAEKIRALLNEHEELVHVTVEFNYPERTSNA